MPPGNRQQKRAAEARRKVSGQNPKTIAPVAMTRKVQQDLQADTDEGEPRDSHQFVGAEKNGQHYPGRHRAGHACEVCSDGHERIPQGQHHGHTASSTTGSIVYQVHPDQARYRDERDQSRNEVKEYQRRLEKAEKEISKLQAEGIAAIDRYQPHTDEAILTKLGQVEKKMVPFVLKTLSKQKTSFGDQEWEENLHDLMLGKPKTLEVGSVDVKNDSRLRRKVLRNVVWRFLCKQLFNQPFRCFQGELAESASSAYEKLFVKPEESEDSTRWRTLTVKRLEELGETQDIDQIRDSLANQFRLEVLNKLGYNFEKEVDHKRLNELLTATVELAQLFAKQRAIFVFRKPMFKSHEVKSLDSLEMTNKDNEYPEVEEEMEGNVWFVIQPALVKFGTGKGERLKEHTVVRKAYVELTKEDSEDVD